MGLMTLGAGGQFVCVPLHLGGLARHSATRGDEFGVGHCVAARGVLTDLPGAIGRILQTAALLPQLFGAAPHVHNARPHVDAGVDLRPACALHGYAGLSLGLTAGLFGRATAFSGMGQTDLASMVAGDAGVIGGDPGGLCMLAGDIRLATVQICLTAGHVGLAAIPVGLTTGELGGAAAPFGLETGFGGGLTGFDGGLTRFDGGLTRFLILSPLSGGHVLQIHNPTVRDEDMASLVAGGRGRRRRGRRRGGTRRPRRSARPRPAETRRRPPACWPRSRG